MSVNVEFAGFYIGLSRVNQNKSHLKKKYKYCEIVIRYLDDGIMYVSCPKFFVICDGRSRGVLKGTPHPKCVVRHFLSSKNNLIKTVKRNRYELTKVYAIDL